jgi:hypothetical protein
MAVAAWPVSAAAATGARSAHGHSASFAGYQVTVAATTATTTFTLPSLTCTSTYSGIVPNITFTNFTTSEFTSAGVYAQCLGGVPNYGASVEINDRFSPLTPTLNAGDKIKLTLKVSATATTATITDATDGSSVKSTVKGPGGGGSFTGASVGDSAVGSPPAPVSQWNKIVFSGTTFNGASLSTYTAAFGSDMYNGATLQILAGNVAANGNFTTTFFHA